MVGFIVFPTSCGSVDTFMQYTEVISPTWANAERTAINALVRFDKIGLVPFTASLNDKTDYSVELFKKITNNTFGPIAEYVKEQTFSPSAPTSITMRQARLVLLKHDLLSTVTEAINKLEGIEKEKALIEWEYAYSVDRDNPLLDYMASLLGIKQSTLDSLFLEGKTL